MQNPKILSFQGRAEAYPHLSLEQRTGRECWSPIQRTIELAVASIGSRSQPWNDRRDDLYRVLWEPEGQEPERI